MGERTSYRPGTFCWTDLSTPDQDAATAFYASLFGWESQDMDMGGGTSYRLMSLGGSVVAAIAPQQPEQREQGVPPLWNSYISVEDVDAVAAAAEGLGGTLAMQPFDVFDAGRMAVLADPQGAYVFLWQPKDHIGAQLVNVHGALAWNELNTTDLAAASAFYGELVGWTTSPVEGETPYLLVHNGEGLNGGIGAVEEGLPPHWLVYFGADDVAATTARATELGARVFLEPMDIGMGIVAVLQDPQGAVFALFQGQMDP